MRALIPAAVLAMLAVGCNDGKLNLLLVFWDDPDPKSSSSHESPGSSSIEILSSSSIEEKLSSSSSEEEISSSSEEVIPTSSSSKEEQASSSSSRGQRYSSSKAYLDYPELEEGASGVKKGWASRYWDGCKPHCSWPDNVETSQPWAICRNCDRDNKEMPAYFLHPDASTYWPGQYLGTPNAGENNLSHEALWERSSVYSDWKITNPAYSGSPAYTCWDMIPHKINDTLAYAFAATPLDGVNRCGKCYQLQFDGDDQKNPGRGRDTHQALIGKTLIVLSNNTGGLEPDQFDIMIPGGGVGACQDAFTKQIGISKENLGPDYGGLLSVCMSKVDYYKTSKEILQNCVIEECHKVFGSSKSKELLDGCLFMADWYMAADNPTFVYKEVECPQYLVDKYRSTIQTEKPPPLY